MSEDATQILTAVLDELRLIRQAQGIEGRSMSREQAAAFLGVHKDTLYRLAREGESAYFHPGDRCKLTFPPDDLLAYRSKTRRAAVE